LYIHIPWCVKKCPYCDFNSHESRFKDGTIPEAAYVDALIADLELATPKVWGRKIKSVLLIIIEGLLAKICPIFD